MSENLGQLLRDKRQREGLSLRQAGTSSGIAWSTLGRIENGGEPSVRVDRAARAWLNGEAPLLPTPPMTLRDWFAGQAILAAGASVGASRNADLPELADAIAKASYLIADAMIAARSAS